MHKQLKIIFKFYFITKLNSGFKMEKILRKKIL